MGSVRKASAWLGLVDDGGDEQYYDEEYSDYSGEPERRDAWVTDPRVRVADERAEREGQRIATVTPDTFRDARGIGELFRDGVPVIVNLTSMDPADAKRVVDFAAGHWWESGMNLLLPSLAPILMSRERLAAGLRQLVAYLHANGVTAINEPGTLAQIATVIADNEGNISNLRMASSAPDFSVMVIDVEVFDVKHLTRLIAQLRARPVVSSVTWVNV